MPEKRYETFYAVEIGAKSRTITEAEASDYRPETVSIYTLSFTDPSIEDEIAASREVAKQGLIAPSGVADGGSVELVKGIVLAQLTLTEWEKHDGAGNLLDKGGKENAKDRLPKAVLRGLACAPSTAKP